ncbi:hypothetical protein EYF80_045712 [Liparis tanakae]|uniref:Uncharacterized protein n=1 Tax=Liparis tanakae TaxID=230148 RepID=A0A4Z2FSA3_9TELE|nr:hypothetical protein EYF80_045712 [Liparis tanakae]
MVPWSSAASKPNTRRKPSWLAHARNLPSGEKANSLSAPSPTVQRSSGLRADLLLQWGAVVPQVFSTLYRYMLPLEWATRNKLSEPGTHRTHNKTPQCFIWVSPHENKHDFLSGGLRAPGLEFPQRRPGTGHSGTTHTTTTSTTLSVTLLNCNDIITHLVHADRGSYCITSHPNPDNGVDTSLHHE